MSAHEWGIQPFQTKDTRSIIQLTIDPGNLAVKLGDEVPGLMWAAAGFPYSVNIIPHVAYGVRRQGYNCVRRRQDRKSTRLNSSHQIISYAVFCLKKKKKNACVEPQQ